MTRIGLVAGSGKLPSVFARVAKDKGDIVIAFALKGVTDSGLEEHVHKIHWFEWGDLKKAVLLLAAERIRKIVMLGKVKKETVFKDDKNLDADAKSILNKIDGKQDYQILNGIADFLGKFGVEVLDSTTYLKDLIPSKGLLTRREPTKKELEDIEYGSSVARTMSMFDIGQTIAVKDRSVIAVEAAEGTDETILRSGSLVKGGFVVVKVARPNQDMRLDVPLIGPDTLMTLIKAGGSVLALEEKKTILMDKDGLVKLADENGISVVII
ncbi:MAG: UDP-2,3-diacylglucosamine diphosphatase LpxI [Candidatus Omnitrophota bacterium]